VIAAHRLHRVNDETQIELRNYWYTIRTPKILCTADQAALRLPAYFGGSVWQLSWNEIAVMDLTATDSEEQESQDDVEFESWLSVPYFFTTAPVSTPNLLLLFRHPQRVPPLTAVAAIAPNVDLPFGFFSTRSAEGDLVDGVLLRADDATRAALTLSDYGAERFSDPVAWMAAHRKTVHDPWSRQELAHRDRRVRVLGMAATVLGWAAFGLLLWAIIRSPFDAWSVLLVGSAVAAGVIAWRLSRSLRAIIRRSRGDGSPTAL
jgi:hypothetical protein